MAAAYEALGQISNNFTIAASFGNVHGVYNPDNVELRPDILKESQTYIKKKYLTSDNPVKFVFHGGSGSSKEQLKQSIDYGVVKMNIDTDLHWAFWDGVRTYHEEHHKNTFTLSWETLRVWTSLIRKTTMQKHGFGKRKKA